MATAYLDRHREGVHPETIKKVAIALARVAFSKTSPPPTEPRERALIASILTDATSVARSVALDITANVDYDHDGSDSQLDTIIDSNWAVIAWIFEGA